MEASVHCGEIIPLRNLSQDHTQNGGVRISKEIPAPIGAAVRGLSPLSGFLWGELTTFPGLLAVAPLGLSFSAFLSGLGGEKMLVAGFTSAGCHLLDRSSATRWMTRSMPGLIKRKLAPPFCRAANLARGSENLTVTHFPEPVNFTGFAEV